MNHEVTTIRENFLRLIFNPEKEQIGKISGLNKGFRVEKRANEQRHVTYEQEKVCMSYWFDKGKVNPDLVTITPTEL